MVAAAKRPAEAAKLNHAMSLLDGPVARTLLPALVVTGARHTPIGALRVEARDGSSWHPRDLAFVPGREPLEPDLTILCGAERARSHIDFLVTYRHRAYAGEALREVAPSFAKHGVQLVGLSTDSMSTLKRFRAAHRVPFRLLSDGTGEVSERYGAIFGFEKRRLTAQKVIVVGKKGVVLYRDERYETKTDTDLRALLRAVGGD